MGGHIPEPGEDHIWMLGAFDGPQLQLDRSSDPAASNSRRLDGDDVLDIDQDRLPGFWAREGNELLHCKFFHNQVL